MSKLTSQTNFNAKPAATDVLHLVDVSDTTDDPNGSSFKVEVADLLEECLERYITIRVVEGDTDVITGTGIGHEFRMPFDGTFLQSDTDKHKFSAYFNIAGAGGPTTVIDVNLNGTSIMTTNKLDIETTEKTSADATTQPDLTTTSFSEGDILTFDVDAVENVTTSPQGLTIQFWVRQTYGG